MEKVKPMLLALISENPSTLPPDPAQFTGWLQTAYQVFLAVYIITLFVLSFYGLHRYILVYLYYKYRSNTPKPARHFDDLPRVCVQLPMFNEQFVARRIIEYTCKIDYPKDKLHIQVLDDSTDSTVGIAKETVERFNSQGFDIEYIHRDDRTGFKAGALANGLKNIDAEYVAIFDADFIPPTDILKNTIHYFTDPKVGMIQSRWDHLNRNHSLLTKSQAILLDGHFMIEHTARNRSGRFMSFNGTAGMWRRACIEQAGGWHHDTLTEDLDLSYRAQMLGWKFIFLPEVISPAELPPEINAFKQQQHRWTKGGAQTAKKLLPTIFKSNLSSKIKFEAFFHLTSCTCYIYIVALTLMLFPALYLRLTVFPDSGLARFFFDISLFLLATCSASAFYLCSQQEIFNQWRDKIKYLPFLMALGIGISVSNTIAALEGFFGKCGEFVRTPKFGMETADDHQWKQKISHVKIKKSFVPWLEFAFGLYMVGCICMCLHFGTAPFSIPFLVLFAVGYFYVSFSSFYLQYQINAKVRESLAGELTLEPVPLTPSARSGHPVNEQLLPAAYEKQLPVRDQT
jgi:cellulose synthase/poly-beta-1,6-N-acetylglucosamine synthase-like glycosyltransferase